MRPLLNGKFVFQLGTLDQGYWPDGIYTAPTDEALRFDLERQKALGFNMVRKHIKVEPARWFYHADQLGLMVWQDMPSLDAVDDASPAGHANYESELRRILDQLKGITSIVQWVPFNEGWGEYDSGPHRRPGPVDRQHPAGQPQLGLQLLRLGSRSAATATSSTTTPTRSSTGHPAARRATGSRCSASSAASAGGSSATSSEPGKGFAYGALYPRRDVADQPVRGDHQAGRAGSCTRAACPRRSTPSRTTWRTRSTASTPTTAGC